MAGETRAEMRDYDAGPKSRAEFRAALSRFGTGVTIVTTATPDGPVGITANSFSSVSLDPPLVLWSASRSSKRFHHFSEASTLAIHILADSQDDLCWAFSKSKHAFDTVEWKPAADGTPLIKGCLARFECKKYAEYDGGDHAIIVSEVQKLSFREGAPLLFYGGKIGLFSDTNPAP